MSLDTTPQLSTSPPATAAKASSLQDAFFLSAEPWLIQSMQRSHSDQVLEREILISMGLQPTSQHDRRLSQLPSLSLGAYVYTPLVFVAWANPAWYSGPGSNEKRQAVIGSLLMQAVAGNPLAFQLVQHWIVSRPPRSLWQTWVRCASAEATDPASAEATNQAAAQASSAPEEFADRTTGAINQEIHQAILDQCHQLAQSTTNLSIDNTQLKSQQRMLRTIEETLGANHCVK